MVRCLNNWKNFQKYHLLIALKLKHPLLYDHTQYFTKKKGSECVNNYLKSYQETKEELRRETVMMYEHKVLKSQIFTNPHDHACSAIRAWRAEIELANLQDSNYEQKRSASRRCANLMEKYKFYNNGSFSNHSNAHDIVEANMNWFDYPKSVSLIKNESGNESSEVTYPFVRKAVEFRHTDFGVIF